MRRWFCGFCLEPQETEDSGKPETCACKIGRCNHCGTYIKEKEKWCHGCGKIGAGCHADMVDAESTGGVYVLHGWIKRNTPTEHGGPYEVWSGKDLETNTWGHVWMRAADGTQRELTDEERVALGYRTRAEFEEAMREKDLGSS